MAQCSKRALFGSGLERCNCWGRRSSTRAAATVCSRMQICVQELKGEDPVWQWVKGSVMGPVLGAMGVGDRARFTALCKERYREAYRQQSDGTTVLPFPRLFMVVCND